MGSVGDAAYDSPPILFKKNYSLQYLVSPPKIQQNFKQNQRNKWAADFRQLTTTALDLKDKSGILLI